MPWHLDIWSIKSNLSEANTFNESPFKKHMNRHIEVCKKERLTMQNDKPDVGQKQNQETGGQYIISYSIFIFRNQ